MKDELALLAEENEKIQNESEQLNKEEQALEVEETRSVFDMMIVSVPSLRVKHTFPWCSLDSYVTTMNRNVSSSKLKMIKRGSWTTHGQS